MKRTVEVKGQKVTYSSRELKSGKTAYYRNGKRVEKYQARIARGILAGKSYSGARGHLSLAEKATKQGRLDETVNSAENPQGGGFGKWAQEATRAPKEAKHKYYALVRVNNDSLPSNKYDPNADDGICTTLTLFLSNPYRNEQDGFTYTEISKHLGPIVRFTLKRYGFVLCTGDIYNDVLGVWRHSE